MVEKRSTMNSPSSSPIELNSLHSGSETFKKTAWNIFIGSVVVIGSIWALFHVAPGLIPDVGVRG